MNAGSFETTLSREGHLILPERLCGNRPIEKVTCWILPGEEAISFAPVPIDEVRYIEKECERTTLFELVAENGLLPLSDAMKLLLGDDSITIMSVGPYAEIWATPTWQKMMQNMEDIDMEEARKMLFPD